MRSVSRRSTLANLAFAAIALFAVGAVACTSPTLPLPPPVPPSITQGTEPNTFKLSSINGAQPNALVIAINRNPDVPRDRRVFGTIADDQGTWELIVFATSGDFFDISQETGSVRSPGTTVEVK